MEKKAPPLVGWKNLEVQAQAELHTTRRMRRGQMHKGRVVGTET